MLLASLSAVLIGDAPAWIERSYVGDTREQCHCSLGNCGGYRVRHIPGGNKVFRGRLLNHNHSVKFTTRSSPTKSGKRQDLKNTALRTSA